MRLLGLILRVLGVMRVIGVKRVIRVIVVIGIIRVLVTVVDCDGSATNERDSGLARGASEPLRPVQWHTS